MYGRLDVGISGWDEGSDCAMYLKKAGSFIHMAAFAGFPRAEKVPKCVLSLQVSAFAKCVIVPLVKTSQWLRPDLVWEMCGREGSHGGSFNNVPG